MLSLGGNDQARRMPVRFSAMMLLAPSVIRCPLKDWSVLTPQTPGPREDIWTPTRQNSSNFGPFSIPSGSPAKQSAVPIDAGNRRAGGHPVFGVGAAAGASNPSMTLRNLILTPIKPPQLSRNRPHMFTL
ncbi:hypothetical protein ACH5RR_028203 [Cinchona calisaya]|uniref:Uncharacterized protein n=1 Tax=Cinchona calisaya TaxID=153742 RepID=A0ABD2YSJ2_9GENT